MSSSSQSACSVSFERRLPPVGLNAALPVVRMRRVQRISDLSRISQTNQVHRGSESAKVLLQQRLTAEQRKSPMPTRCNPKRFEFARAEGRPAVASFDGGAVTSDAGVLLLAATERVLALTRRLAAGFKDSRNAAYTEHAVETLVMQRIVGIAPGYEDLNDHDG
jgi:hypothetical protein